MLEVEYIFYLAEIKLRLRMNCPSSLIGRKKEFSAHQMVKPLFFGLLLCKEKIRLNEQKCNVHQHKVLLHA